MNPSNPFPEASPSNSFNEKNPPDGNEVEPPNPFPKDDYLEEKNSEDRNEKDTNNPFLAADYLEEKNSEDRNENHTTDLFLMASPDLEEKGLSNGNSIFQASSLEENNHVDGDDREAFNSSLMANNGSDGDDSDDFLNATPSKNLEGKFSVAGDHMDRPDLIPITSHSDNLQEKNPNDCSAMDAPSGNLQEKNLNDCDDTDSFISLVMASPSNNLQEKNPDDGDDTESFISFFVGPPSCNLLETNSYDGDCPQKLCFTKLKFPERDIISSSIQSNAVSDQNDGSSRVETESSIQSMASDDKNPEVNFVSHQNSNTNRVKLGCLMQSNSDESSSKANCPNGLRQKINGLENFTLDGRTGLDSNKQSPNVNGKVGMASKSPLCSLNIFNKKPLKNFARYSCSSNESFHTDSNGQGSSCSSIYSSYSDWDSKEKPPFRPSQILPKLQPRKWTATSLGSLKAAIKTWKTNGKNKLLRKGDLVKEVIKTWETNGKSELPRKGNPVVRPLKEANMMQEMNGGENELWRKRILMGKRCQPLNYSGVIHYDENGNHVAESPSMFEKQSANL